jgi:hypothetical protein
MNWLQSLLLGMASAGTTALLGSRLARWRSRHEDTRPTRGFDDRLAGQLEQFSSVLFLLSLLLLVVGLMVVVGVVLALWPAGDAVLFWLAVAMSLPGYALSFYLARVLAPLAGTVGRTGRRIYRGSLVVWTMGLLGLALGAHPAWYVEPSRGELEDVVARLIISLGAACIICALVAVTVLQGIALSVLRTAQHNQPLKPYQRAAWHLIDPGTLVALIITAGGFLLASGILL